MKQYYLRLVFLISCCVGGLVYSPTQAQNVEIGISNATFPFYSYMRPLYTYCCDSFYVDATVFCEGDDTTDVILEYILAFEDNTPILEVRDTITMFPNSVDTGTMAFLLPNLYSQFYKMEYRVSFLDQSLSDSLHNNIYTYSFYMDQMFHGKEISDASERLTWPYSQNEYCLSCNFYRLSSTNQYGASQFYGAAVAPYALDGQLDDEVMALYLFEWKDDNDNVPDISTELVGIPISPFDNQNLHLKTFAGLSFEGMDQHELGHFDVGSGFWLDEQGEETYYVVCDVGSYVLLCAEFDPCKVGVSMTQNANNEPLSRFIYDFTTSSPNHGYDFDLDDYQPVIRGWFGYYESTEDHMPPPLQIDIFPSITNDFMTIRLDEAISKPVKCSILSTDGRLMSSFNFDGVEGRQKLIDLSSFPIGLYYVKVAVEGRQKVVSVIKQ